MHLPTCYKKDKQITHAYFSSQNQTHDVNCEVLKKHQMKGGSRKQRWNGSILGGSCHNSYFVPKNVNQTKKKNKKRTKCDAPCKDLTMLVA